MAQWKVDNIKKNPRFCVVPWTHTYLSPQTERRLCCASREPSQFVQQYIDRRGQELQKDYQPTSLQEHWNSPYMKDLRRRMLSGEKLSECEVCNEQVLSLSTYRHWFTNHLFPDRIKDIAEQTDEEGGTTLVPISFDYRFSNACNFKCRTCGDQFSSSWEQENKLAGAYDQHREPWLEPATRHRIKDFQSTTVEGEFAEAVRSKQIRELYWVGGEPLVWPQHWQYMKEIIDLGYADQVYARYNTNLSVIQKGNTGLFTDLLPHFKDYMISASIDGAGEIGEFLRTGLDWELWKTHFAEGVKASKGRSETAMLFDVTLSLPSLFCLEELVEEALRFDVRIETKVMYGFDPFVLLHPLAPPREALHSLIDENLRKLEGKVGPKQQSLIATLQELKKRPVFSEQFPQNYRKEFFRGRTYLQEISARRPEAKVSFESIYRQHPAIYDWWMQEHE